MAVRVFWVAEVGEEIVGQAASLPFWREMAGEWRKSNRAAARGSERRRDREWQAGSLPYVERGQIMIRPLMIAAALTVLAWVGTAVVYPWLPATIPTHWNIKGVADQYSPKTYGAFLLPIAILRSSMLLRLLRSASLVWDRSRDPKLWAEFISQFDPAKTRILLITRREPRTAGAEFRLISDRYGGSRDRCTILRSIVETKRDAIVAVLKQMPARFRQCALYRPDRPVLRQPSVQTGRR